MFDPIWTTRDGRRMRIGAMDASHILNCIRLIESRRAWRRRFLARLYLELEIRKIT